MKEFIKNIKRTWQYTKYQKKRYLLYVLCHILGIILGIVLPILSARVIIHLTNNKFYELICIAIVIFFVDSMSSLIWYLERHLTQRINRETFSLIQNDLCKETLKLENEVIDSKGTGAFISRISNDATRLSDVFNSITFFFSGIIKNIGILIAIFIINKLFFIYAFLMSIFVSLIDYRRTKAKNERDKEYRKKQDIVTGFISEMIRGVRDVKMLNAESSFLSTSNQKVKDLNEERYKMQKVDRMWAFVVTELENLHDLLTIVLIVILIINKRLAIANALVLYNYTRQTTNISYYVSTLLDYVVDFNLSCDRVFEILGNKVYKKEKFGKEHINNLDGRFEFKNVSFSYNNDSVVLKNISFKIKANETVGFVGKSGAGKTTIFNLLCKLYPDYKGKISIDDIDIRDLDKDSIRGNITIISQNPYIFNLSIKENLKLVKDGVTDAEIVEACKTACLDDFINTLEKKYDTVIGEGGVTLSGGQKQRLAIARALIQKTKVILFDEATSALDNETQEKIQKAIDNMKNNYTIMIIAHRLSTIVNCDRILFLNNGRIEAEGTHKELLQNCKEYKKLYEAEIEKEN